jgi:hypothetical protein
MTKRIYKKSEKVAFMAVSSVFLAASVFVSTIFMTAGCVNAYNSKSTERSVVDEADKITSCTTWALANVEISGFEDDTDVTLKGYQILNGNSEIIASSYSNDGRNDFDSFVSAWKNGNKIEFDVYRNFSTEEIVSSELAAKFFTISFVGSSSESVSLIKKDVTFSYFADIMPKEVTGA